MSSGSRASKRKIISKTEVPTPKSSKKWSEEDIEKYLSCIMENGHKNLEKLEKCFPERSSEAIKTFLRTAYDTAIRLEEGNSNIDAWLQHCKVAGETPPWKDSMQTAQVLKYLSVDGLVENHPLPSQCQGINFPEAYRLIYQTLMGYPIQPVSQQTSDFVLNTFKELAVEIKKEIIPTKNVSEFLKRKLSDASSNEETKASANNNLPPVKSETIASNDIKFGKPLKVYQRKKPKLSNEAGVPTMKIVVEANDNASNSCCTKDFSVTIDGNTNGSTPTVLNVPVPVKMDSFNDFDKDEKELLQSATYNPFKIPEKWLKEPLYTNLLAKTFDASGSIPS